MRIKPLGANKTELHLSNGTIVLFSYETPVAAHLYAGFVRTEKKWSRTTSKHINQWLDGATAIEWSQERIEALVGE